MKKFAFMAAGLLLAGTAHAIPVSFTGTQTQTVDGEDFAFNFAPAAASDGGTGTLDIEVRGDFTIGVISEFFNYDVDGIVHYCVANMPGAVPLTSTVALTNATLPYALKIADQGWQKAARDTAGVKEGLNVVCGKVTYAGVAEAFGLDYTAAEDVMG